MLRSLVALSVAAAALVAVTAATAPRVHPDTEYRNDRAYDCTAPGEAGANTMTYRGHVHMELTNGSRDPVAERDYFYSDGDGGYETVTFRAQYRVSGHVINGEAWTNGGGPADISGFSTYCVNVP